MVSNLPANAGDDRDKISILESGRLTGIGNSNFFQCSCLENSTEKPGRLWSTGSWVGHKWVQTHTLKWEQVSTFEEDCPVLVSRKHKMDLRLSHVQGQGQWPEGATLRPRSGGCTGAGGPRGATPHSRSGGAAMRRYPSSKVRSSTWALLEGREEIFHVQGKRHLSKMVGVARGHQRADTLKP